MAAIDTAQISTAADFSATLVRASELAVRFGAAEVGLEHLLGALCDDPDAVAILDASPVDIENLKADVFSRISGGSPNSVAVDAAGLSHDVQRILDAAAEAAKGTRHHDINGTIMIAAMVGDDSNIGAEILKAHGLTFEAAIRALQSARQPAKSATRQATLTPKPSVGAPPHPQIDVKAPQESSLAPQEQLNDTGAKPLPSLALPDFAVPPWIVETPSAEKQAAADTHGARPFGDSKMNPESEPRHKPEIFPAPVPTFAHSVPNEPVFSQPPASYPMPTDAPAPFPFAPFTAYPERPLPAEPRFGDAGYGLSPPQQSLGHAPVSSDMLETIARRRPVPSGIQPPPIPAGIAIPAFLDSRTRIAAPVGHQPAVQPTVLRDQKLSGERAIPSAAPAQQAKAVKRKRANVEPGQLAENIPRAMRVGRTERAEIRIAKTSVTALTDGAEGNGRASRQPGALTTAIAVRLRAPEGGFFIEPMSPETQWIDNKPGYGSDEFASWRFWITPQSRGWSRLQIVVSARTVGADGAPVETTLPDTIIEAKVRRNIARSFTHLLGWTVAAAIGGTLAKFAAPGIEFAKTYALNFLQ